MIPRRLYDQLSCALFILRGRRPWTLGYDAYKKREIIKVLRKDQFSVESLPRGYGFRLDERIIEYPWILSRLPEGPGRLLDAGSTLNFDFVMSHPSLLRKRMFISTLAPERNCFWKRGISYVYEDLRETCYREDYFDWVVSLSTIEHIGMDNTMLYTKDASKKENAPDAYMLALWEYRRILKPRGVLYLSFPFGRYQNRGWFQVFDGARVDALIRHFSPSSVKEELFRYASEGWKISSREESKEATCFDIHRQKSYDDDYAAFSRAIVCLELIK